MMQSMGAILILFLSTLSLRRATPRVVREPATSRFLSTLSLRRATIITPHSTPDNGNFYPRSPCGERLKKSLPMCTIRHFYPRSPCGERLHLFTSSGVDFAISIHALLAESDVAPVLAVGRAGYFYPRSPCGERQKLLLLLMMIHLFLSTLSLRRATILGRAEVV